MSQRPGPCLRRLPWPRRRLLIGAASAALAVVLVQVARGAVRAVELNAGSQCLLAHRADPLHAGALAGAIRWYARADHAGSASSRARAGHVRALVAAGQAEAGAALLESPSATVDPFAGLEVGAALWEGGARDAAMRWWRAVPDLDVYFMRRGRQRAPRDRAAAMGDYEASWAIDDRPVPAKGEGLLALCEALRRQGDRQRAAAVCTRAVEAGNAYWGEIVLGLLRCDERDFRGGAEHFRRATEVGPAKPVAYGWLGWALIAQGKPAEAAAALEPGRRLAPGDPRLGYLMGRALWDAGRTAEACASLRATAADAPGGFDELSRNDALRLLGLCAQR